MGLPIDMLLLYQHIENLQCIESGFVIDDGGRGGEFFGKFLQGGTPGEGMCLPWRRPFQNVKNP